MVLSNADISSGQGTPAANAAEGSTSNLAVMDITGFVATQEIDQLAQLAQTVPDLSKALEQGTVDREMFKKVLEQLRASEAQKTSQGLVKRCPMCGSLSPCSLGPHYLLARFIHRSVVLLTSSMSIGPLPIIVLGAAD